MKKYFVFAGMGLLFLTGCASSHHKARLEQREKLAGSSGLYCEWINGDKFSDIEVELNLQMAKRCDAGKPFSLTPYKNSSDANGILYCCAMAQGSESKAPATSAAPSPVTKKKSSTPSASAAASGPVSAEAKAGAQQEPDIVEDK